MRPFFAPSSLLLLLASVVVLAGGQLLINVKNRGGDVVSESIRSNVSEDAVTLEFQRSDGILITQLVDFTNEVQIVKALVLGEEERGQSQYQVLCFLLHADKTDYISADAMAKLRQKNPGTVRSAEEDRGRSNHSMSAWVIRGRSGAISRHAPALCAEAEAEGAVYTSRADIAAWASLPGASLSALEEATRPFPASPSSSPCGALRGALSSSTPCRCRLEVCIGWYPCGLKYCKGRGPPAAAPLSYRCGINTCRRCQLFEYHVPRKLHCLWDDDPRA